MSKFIGCESLIFNRGMDMERPGFLKDWILKYALILIGAIVILTTIVAFASSFIFQDFSIYHQATSLWLEGKNPYILPAHQSYLEGYIGEMSPVTNISMRVLAPPYFLITMTPFALLSIAVAKKFYLILLFLGFFLWFWLTVRELNRYQSTDRNYQPLAWLGAVLTQPFFIWQVGVSWGGMGILSTLGVFLLTRFKNYGSLLGWALFWFLLSLKPHIFIYGALFLLLKLSSRVRYQNFIAFLLVFSCINCFLWLYSPEVFKNFFDSLAFNIASSLQYKNDTLLGLLLRLSVPREVAISILLLVGIPLVALAIRPIKINSFQEIVALAILFNTAGLFLSFYGWAHDFQSSAGWFWATLVLGIRSGWLYWTNIAGLLLINIAYLISHSYYVAVFQGAWWVLVMVNLLAIYRLPARAVDASGTLLKG